MTVCFVGKQMKRKEEEATSRNFDERKQDTNENRSIGEIHKEYAHQRKCRMKKRRNNNKMTNSVTPAYFGPRNSNAISPCSPQARDTHVLHGHCFALRTRRIKVERLLLNYTDKL